MSHATEPSRKAVLLRIRGAIARTGTGANHSIHQIG